VSEREGTKFWVENGGGEARVGGGTQLRGPKLSQTEEGPLERNEKFQGDFFLAPCSLSVRSERAVGLEGKAVKRKPDRKWYFAFCPASPFPKRGNIPEADFKASVQGTSFHDMES